MTDCRPVQLVHDAGSSRPSSPIVNCRSWQYRYVDILGKPITRRTRNPKGRLAAWEAANRAERPIEQYRCGQNRGHDNWRLWRWRWCPLPTSRHACWHGPDHLDHAFALMASSTARPRRSLRCWTPAAERSRRRRRDRGRVGSDNVPEHATADLNTPATPDPPEPRRRGPSA
jgi:hypothetical protein